MAETLRNVLVMEFQENAGTKKHSLRIPDPRADLTGKMVKSAMDSVADTGYIWDDVRAIGAKVVKTSTDTLDITAG